MRESDQSKSKEIAELKRQLDEQKQLVASMQTGGGAKSIKSNATVAPGSPVIHNANRGFWFSFFIFFFVLKLKFSFNNSSNDDIHDSNDIHDDIE